MEITYGAVDFESEQTRISGRMILSEHKLFVRKEAEDLAATFVPLEKIERIRLESSRLVMVVRPAIMSKYQAVIRGEKKNIVELAAELVKRRGLKKKFLKKEWFDPNP